MSQSLIFYPKHAWNWYGTRGKPAITYTDTLRKDTGVEASDLNEVKCRTEVSGVLFSSDIVTPEPLPNRKG